MMSEGAGRAGFSKAQAAQSPHTRYCAFRHLSPCHPTTSFFAASNTPAHPQPAQATARWHTHPMMSHPHARSARLGRRQLNTLGSCCCENELETAAVNPKKRIQNTRLIRLMPLRLEHDRFHLRVGCDLVDKALVVAGEDHRLACAQAVRDDVVRLGAAGGVE